MNEETFYGRKRASKNEHLSQIWCKNQSFQPEKIRYASANKNIPLLQFANERDKAHNV